MVEVGHLRREAAGRRRARVSLAAGAGTALLLAIAMTTMPRALAPPTGQLISKTSYRLLVNQSTGVVVLQTPDAQQVSSFPLAMSAGAGLGTLGGRLRVTAAGDTVHATRFAAGGAVIEDAALTAFPDWFTVRYSLGQVGPQATTPRFFFDGARGFDVSGVHAGFTPDAPAGSGWPVLATAGRRPLAPAPLQVQLRTSRGWLGVGLLHVPNATQLRFEPGGAVAVDYPLHVLHSIPDTGAGGWSGGLVRFPAFAVTLAPDTASGLAAYHQAVAAAGAAPAAAPQQAAWWHMPIVDTWGAQMAEHVQRGSSGFTTAWVRAFVAQAQQRYGLQHFTLVIDSRWQEQLGGAAPDAARFGGVAGMRSLIDDLHAQRLRVLLWWPMWSTGRPTGASAPAVQAGVDPTAPGFEDAMRSTVTEMLGQGPGDLAADGLKLDWEYAIPQETANPSLGVGDSALYHYLDVIHSAAHAVRADALVEASAASPQFETVSDSVRLYDAWSERAWDQRAAIVAAAEPGVLIDGDGWEVSPSDAVAHVLSSTVYGVPALYFGSTWASGAPVPDTTARLLGTVASLAEDKRSGRVMQLPGGGWEFISQGHAVAQTLNGETGAVVWTPVSHGRLLGHAVSSVGGLVQIPLPRQGAVAVTTASGTPVSVQLVGSRALLRLTAHSLYTITIR
jgi:hypothetical protein